MMAIKNVDVLVIGGGLLGCFTARNLCRWNLDTLLIEAEEDVCMGITRANSAIVYSGCDNKPGSLKARLTVKSNRRFATLCNELDVSFKQCGSLMVSESSKADAILEKKLYQGWQNGVTEMHILSGEEARKIEPLLSASITSALYVPCSATVNPWQLGIAALENAVANGCCVERQTCVITIVQENDSYIVETNRGVIRCRAIVNCAGLSSVQIQEMVFASLVRLKYDAADYLVFDKAAPIPQHIIFQENEDGKGATLVPTIEGTLLVGSPARPLSSEFWATTLEGLEKLTVLTKRLLPKLNMDAIIRSFAAVRPNPYMVSKEKKRLNDFMIERPAVNFFSFIGIKTPGLTCANELGAYVAEQLAVYLSASENKNFSPYRQHNYKKDHEIICQCEQITKGEIMTAIANGACTVDGVKHRVGCGMGRCQGARCRYRIEKLLEESKHGIL